MNRRKLLLALGASLVGAVAAGGAARAARGGNRYYSGPVSDHFDGTRFFNPGGEEPAGFQEFLRWQFGGGREAWPERWPENPIAATPLPRVEGEGMRVTMIGHATLLIQTASLNILTDPVYSDRASPSRFLGPRRHNPPGIAFDALPPIDVVLLSHNHYDHLDVETLARLHAAHDPVVVTPLGNDAIVHAAVPAMRVETLDWGGSLSVDGATIHAEPAHHWSARGLRDRRMALWAAFVVETGAGRIYHVGDTGFHSGINYRAAGERHGGFRLAILPIGAYEPRWFMRPQHQNPAEAVAGLKLCGARYGVGHHWGTFQLTDEGVLRPEADLRTALAAAGIEPARFPALRPGQHFDVPPTGGA